MATQKFLGNLRLALLLAVLVFVAPGTWLDRARSREWNDTLRITVYPIAQTAGPAALTYVNALQVSDFADVETFFAQDIAQYGVPLAQSVRMRVSQAAHAAPPGLGEPGLDLLYPQEFGEIMGERVADGPRAATTAASLDLLLVGPQTAAEIGWAS